ncbi:MAG: RseA family anti-sigma factor [Pseudomonadota bacterium]
MNESTKEHLSAYIDGEHDDKHLVDELIRNEDMKKTWTRYHLIGDCLRDNLPDQISNDHISNNVQNSLQNEPTVLAPKTKRFDIKPLAGLAIAASVAMIAILGIQSGNELNPATSGSPAIATSDGSGVESFNFSEAQVLPAAVKQSDTPQHLTNERLNEYLMNHNTYRSNGGVNGVLPYVRMVTIEPQE